MTEFGLQIMQQRHGRGAEKLLAVRSGPIHD